MDIDTITDAQAKSILDRLMHNIGYNSAKLFDYPYVENTSYLVGIDDRLANDVLNGLYTNGLYSSDPPALVLFNNKEPKTVYKSCLKTLLEISSNGLDLVFVIKCNNRWNSTTFIPKCSTLESILISLDLENT